MKSEANADKRRVISPHSVSPALNAQWAAGLWKSKSFLLFVVTASHVNDQFGRKNLINISGSQRVGEGLSVCLLLLLWVCRVTLNACGAGRRFLNAKHDAQTDEVCDENRAFHVRLLLITLQCRIIHKACSISHYGGWSYRLYSSVSKT